MMKSNRLWGTAALAAVLSCTVWGVTLPLVATSVGQAVSIATEKPTRLFVGDAKTAYRDPAAVWVAGTCHLFFTLVETEADGSVHSYVATATSRDLRTWSPVTKLTPRSDRDYSSPGNVVQVGEEWMLCFQSYPRPGNRDDGKVRYADASARLFTMRTRNFTDWTPPELLAVKGPAVAEADMGRMIDPYLVKDPKGGWLCFYKQNGVSCSRSSDLKTWQYLGRREAGENVCVAAEEGHYVLMHSPQNGMQLKISDDLLAWRDVPGTITLGQKDWPWARGRLTAGFLLDGRAIPGLGQWALFFHGSGPRTEREGDFDRNASIGVAFAPRIADFLDKVAEAPLSTDGARGVAATPGSTGPVTSASVRAALQPYVDRGELAGAVSMTSVSGKVETVYVGLADPRTGRPFDEHSFFWIASMTKGFTAAAVMTCVDKGLLSLDDTIEKYIPEMANVKVAEKGLLGIEHLRPAKVKMTLRMCLSHQAGFPFNSPISEARGGRTMTLAEHATAAAACPLLWDPLTKHKYSNVDINLAGRVVEIVTGVRFEDYLQKTFFDPLGMKEITFFPTPEQVARRVYVARVAKGKRYADGNDDHWARMWRADVIAQTKTGIPAGGLYATAGEVMKFYQMLANDGCAPDGTRILSHASIVALSTAQYPKSDCYSLGLRQYGDWFGHDGALQTSAFANWKENRVCLLYVQLTGEWRHPFKADWYRAVGLSR